MEENGELSGFVGFLYENYSSEWFVVYDLRNYKDSVMILMKRKDRKNGICPKCGGKRSVKKLRNCRVRDLDLVKKCYIEFEQAEIRCPCGYNGVEKLDIINGNEKYTQRFVTRVICLLNAMDTSDAANICRISEKTAESIEKSYYVSFADKNLGKMKESECSFAPSIDQDMLEDKNIKEYKTIRRKL